MFVQRLPRWLRRFVAPLFHLHARSYDPIPPERTAVLSASLRGDSDTRTGAGTGTSGGASWLDDGRRLRPRPSPPAKLDQRWNARPAAPRQSVPTQAQPGRAPSLRPAEPPISELPRTKPAEPAARREQPIPPALPEQAGQASLPAFDAPSSGDEQHIYRRLMALKRLVRLGIYNEGFDPNHIPEQYRSSLGREDDLPSE